MFEELCCFDETLAPCCFDVKLEPRCCAEMLEQRWVAGTRVWSLGQTRDGY